jgi:hypothetical protein
MPHLSAPITKNGVLVQCDFAVTPPRSRELATAGQHPRPSIRVQAVLDTGAQSTCIHARIVMELGLPRRGRMWVHTSSGTTSCPVYEASIAIPGVLSLDVVRVVETGLVTGRSYEALIGRDVLAACVFNYDGPSSTATLSSGTAGQTVPAVAPAGFLTRFRKWMARR